MPLEQYLVVNKCTEFRDEIFYYANPSYKKERREVVIVSRLVK